MTSLADLVGNTRCALDEAQQHDEVRAHPRLRALLRQAYDLVAQVEDVLAAGAEEPAGKVTKQAPSKARKLTMPQRVLLAEAVAVLPHGISTKCGLGTAVKTRTAEKLVAIGLFDRVREHTYLATKAGVERHHAMQQQKTR